MAAKQVPGPSRTTEENLLSTLYQKEMVTEQEMQQLRPLVRPWGRLVHIQCTKPPDVVKRTADLLAEVGHVWKGKQLKVLADLYQKKVMAKDDVQKWDRLLDLIFDLCIRPSEDVATTADVLDMVGWKKGAEMLRVLSVLYQKKVLAHHEVVEVRHERELGLLYMVLGEEDLRVGETLWQGLIGVQCRKPPEVVTTTAEVLNELELKEEATQLRVMSELYQNRLISEDDLSCLSHRHFMMEYSSRHWLDSLVHIQSSKSADVRARTFATLRSYSLTEVVEDTQVETVYGLKTSEKLPSSSSKRILLEWGRLPKPLLSKDSTTSEPLETLQPSQFKSPVTLPSRYPAKTLEGPQTLSEPPSVKETQLESSLAELSVSPPRTKVSSLQAGGGSDPPEREDASNLLTDEAALKRLCWIPFGIKTVSIEAKGGTLCLEPQTDDIQVTKEDTIFVEVPPDAVSTSANVKMRYAIIPCGPFTLPEGYQFGSPVVYINYDDRHVTKPLTLHLPHWYGGKDHARDGLSFAVAPHSLKGRSVYHFQLPAGREFSGSSRYGVVEIHGHCSLYAEVFKLGATKKYLATFLVKEERGKNKCNIAVTYDSTHWAQILQQRCRYGWKASKHDPFQFKQDRITATFNDSHHVYGDWHADFTGTSELLASDVQYDSRGIDSHRLLETAVKNCSYPPTIDSVVEYREKLKRKGRRTVVKLHISGMDRKMEFPCTAYEQIQAAPPPPTAGPAQTATTSLSEAGLLPPPPVSPAQSMHTGAAHTLSLGPPLSEATSTTPPTQPEGATQTRTNRAAATPPTQPEGATQTRTDRTAATFVQVLQDHAEEFLEKMNSEVLASRLKVLGLIPETVKNKVLQSMNRTDANSHLLSHLKTDADVKVVSEVFRVASRETDYGNMSAFAAKMLEILQQGSNEESSLGIN